MLDQLFVDAALKPHLFRWNGPLPRTDLRRLWPATGGGEPFESEELWVLLAPPMLGEDFEGVNAWYRQNGMDARCLVFHTGCFVVAVRQPHGALVELVGSTHAEGRTFGSLDEWYGLLRAEYGWRYGLPGAAPPAR
jgi:hypothetical protein